jgi:putative tricarboxylic transport membrane protein
MRKFDTISGLFLLLVSVAICVGSLRLDVGTPNTPGSGFFPLLTGLVLAAFSIIILVQARKEEDKPVRFWEPGANRKGIYLSFLFILFYALLLERAGFVVSTIVFFILMSRFVCGHTWRTTILFSTVTAFATYAVFAYVLHAPLPTGLLGRMF